VLISVVGTDSAPPIDIVGETNYHPMPDYTLRVFAIYAQCVRDLMILADKRR